jgi:hypothetical protein
LIEANRERRTVSIDIAIEQVPAVLASSRLAAHESDAKSRADGHRHARPF